MVMDNSRPHTVSASPSLPQAERTALFARLLGRQLGRMLRLVDLEAIGSTVAVEAFAAGTAPAPADAETRSSAGRYEALPSWARNEPRVEYIHNALARALRLGRFAAGGKTLAVDGFRLRGLRQWAIFPTGSLRNNIGSLSSYCNCDCEFCYEKGTRGSGIVLGRSQLSRQEVATRARYYSPEQGTGIIPSARFSLEPFANPHCLEILERLHALAPEEGIDITTNGACLTEEVVARLAALRPLMLCISLNSASVGERTRGMRDHVRGGAETALASLKLLRQYGIPFIASYVPWPTKPLADLEAMLRLVDRYDGVMARVCLPSWTRCSHAEAPFDTDQYWPEILTVVDRMRAEVAVPIHCTPNLYQLHTLRPVVQGTLKHSPAAQAGFRYGDLITTIAGEPVFSRPEVSNFLEQRFRDRAIRSTRFTVERQGEQVTLEVPHAHDPEALAYPYRQLLQPGIPGNWASTLGIHLTDGFRLQSFMALKEIVEEHAGKRVLLFVSELGKPLFLEGMEMLGEAAQFIGKAQVSAQVLRPRTWGGNVMLGDLWTTDDVIEGTREWITRHGIRPDLVVIPGSFLSYGGRDLLGHSYLEVERALDIELRLLPCDCISI